VGVQERLFVRRRQAQERQHLGAASRAVDEPAARVARGQRAQRIRARHVGRQDAAVVLRRGVVVARLVAVQRRQRLARRQVLRIQLDDLLVRFDRAGRVARLQQLAVTLPQARAAAARRRLIGGRR
jgi:hypothetical protein